MSPDYSEKIKRKIKKKRQSSKSSWRQHQLSPRTKSWRI